jgi:flagellar biosynthesis protein FlhB
LLTLESESAMMKLILNESFVNFLFFVLAFLTPSIVVVLVAGLRKKIWTGEARLWLVLAAAAGPVNLLLWIIYNAIENAYGLDSVRALLLNLLFFLLLGIIAGIIIRRYRNRLLTQKREDTSSPRDDKSGVADS